MSLSFTWLGHATFLLQSPGGKRIVLDPWVTGNPTSPEAAKKLGTLDLMLITHGHSDHTADAVSIARSSGAQVVAPYEVSVWLGKKGLQKVTPMKPGGTPQILGPSITMGAGVPHKPVGEKGPNRYPRVAAGYGDRIRRRLTDHLSG